MYDDQMFFVANPINRYSMSLRTNPKFESDGSLVIYIQNESPGADKEANWLPAPKGKFHADAASLLAGRERAFDPRRVVGDPGGEEDLMTASSRRAEQIERIRSAGPARGADRSDSKPGSPGLEGCTVAQQKYTRNSCLKPKSVL